MKIAFVTECDYELSGGAEGCDLVVFPFFRGGAVSYDKDIKGKRYYQVATGELSAGAVITLREIMIGDVKLKDVEASVVNNQRAPLLFGQSAMERFGTITIDNEHNKLIIKH